MAYNLTPGEIYSACLHCGVYDLPGTPHQCAPSVASLLQQYQQQYQYQQMANNASSLWSMPGSIGSSVAYKVTMGVSASDPVGLVKMDMTKVEALKQATPRKIGQRVPDSVAPIVGWRAWKLLSVKGEWRLGALGMSGTWEPKKAMEAVCSHSRNHPAPNKDCECGLWAFDSLDKLIPAAESYAPQVFGEVSLWGRIIVTENGYRAQCAYPKELWLLDETLEQLGYIYGVPVRTP